MGSELFTSAGAADLRAQLESLEAERAQAALSGLEANGLYMADLEHERAATRAAYVGMAVTEIACLRAALGGRLIG